MCPSQCFSVEFSSRYSFASVSSSSNSEVVCPAFLVQPPFGTCVNAVEEDVMVDCCWTYHGVRGMRMLFSMAPLSDWSGNRAVATVTILHWSCVALSNCSPCSAVV